MYVTSEACMCMKSFAYLQCHINTLHNMTFVCSFYTWTITNPELLQSLKIESYIQCWDNVKKVSSVRALFFFILYSFFPPRPVTQMMMMTTMKRRKKQIPSPMRAAYSGGIDRNSSQRLIWTSDVGVVELLCEYTVCTPICNSSRLRTTWSRCMAEMALFIILCSYVDPSGKILVVQILAGIYSQFNLNLHWN